MSDPAKKLKAQIKQTVVVLLTILAICGTLFTTQVFAQDSDENDHSDDEIISSEKAGVQKFGLIAASVAFGLGAIGAGLAISHVGAAAMGAVAEKPEIAGQALIFVALAEGIVVFGFITALMILGKV
ncbi:MAG: ATPase [Planctomycetes bacterium]|nr:ATPase [Planctomycetota bacterium]